MQTGTSHETSGARGTGPTLDPAEVARFDAMAGQWWDAQGPMAVLHKFNPVRLAYIRDRACAHFDRDPRGMEALQGLSLVDIGCGGGVLSEPLCRLGARVTGLDPAHANIEVARAHARAGGLEIDYRASLIEDVLAGGERFDIVLAMEVVEHVADVPAFIKAVAGAVKPGGFLVMATLNRTLKSFALAIVGAEYVLGWLPRGTHDWQKFVTPQELETLLAGEGFVAGNETGVVYSPLSGRWSPSRDLDVNYMLTATRGADSRRMPR